MQNFPKPGVLLPLLLLAVIAFSLSFVADSTGRNFWAAAVAPILGEVLGDTSGLQYTLTKSGINSLSYDGETLINTGSWRNSNEGTWQNVYLGCKAWIVNGVKTSSCTSTETSRSIDLLSNKITLNHTWGKAEVDHRLSAPDTLEISVKVINNDPVNTLAGFSMSFLSSLFYNTAIYPTISTSTQNFNADNRRPESPAGGYVNYTSGAFAFWTNLVDKATRLSASSHHNDSYSTGITIGADQWDNESKYHISIPPGQSYDFKVYYKFGDASASKHTLMQPAYDAFRSVYPQMLNWSDNRPILRDFIAESTKSTPTNPRGYLKGEAHLIDIYTQSGRDLLRTKLLGYADKNITYMRDMNAQGIIIWDFDGQEFPHAFTYVGQPQLISVLAPEMDAIADEYLGKIRDAGFRVGLTLRPQRIGGGTVLPENCFRADYPDGEIFIKTDAPYGQRRYVCGPDGWYVTQSTWGWQQELHDNDVIAQELISKITYAKNRWGVTMFYIDSVQPVSEVFEKILQAHPDVLLIPEFESARTFRSTAPYNEMRGGWAHVPTWAIDVYPNAKSVITVTDVSQATFESRYNDLVNGVRNGNLILMGNGFLNSPEQAWIKQVYAAAGVTPPPPPPSDTQSPTVPSSLSATAASSTQINLSWSASTDNVAVTGYRVARNGTHLATTTSTSFQNINLTPNTTYTYAVSAFDAAGNVSAQSAPASATTPSDPVPPPPPSPPAETAPVITEVTATNITTTQATISWITDVDSDSQVEYGTSATQLFNSTSVNPNLVKGHIVNLTGLTKKTKYYYRVKSKAANGLTATSPVFQFQTKSSEPRNRGAAVITAEEDGRGPLDWWFDLVYKLVD